jgi:hypothetical protein
MNSMYNLNKHIKNNMVMMKNIIDITNIKKIYNILMNIIIYIIKD